MYIFKIFIEVAAYLYQLFKPFKDIIKGGYLLFKTIRSPRTSFEVIVKDGGKVSEQHEFLDRFGGLKTLVSFLTSPFLMLIYQSIGVGIMLFYPPFKLISTNLNVLGCIACQASIFYSYHKEIENLNYVKALKQLDALVTMRLDKTTAEPSASAVAVSPIASVPLSMVAIAPVAPIALRETAISLHKSSRCLDMLKDLMERHFLEHAFIISGTTLELVFSRSRYYTPLVFFGVSFIPRYFQNINYIGELTALESSVTAKIRTLGDQVKFPSVNPKNIHTTYRAFIKGSGRGVDKPIPSISLTDYIAKEILFAHLYSDSICPKLRYQL